MKSAPKPLNEKQRIESLLSLDILDTISEPEYDQITFLASQICNTPIALISLVDNERQWFKSKKGIDAIETSRDIAFCAHAILEKEVFVVPDSSKDNRFSDNPLATGGPNVQFYAGAPLMSPDGLPIGTVCVIDNVARELSAEQIAALKVLSDQVTKLLQLRTHVKILKKSEEELKFKNKAIEIVAEGIVLQDTTGKIIEFNKTAPALLNLTPEQLLGKSSIDPSWQAIKADGSDFPGKDHPAMVCLKTGLPQVNVIMGIRNSKADTRWIKINSTPVFQNSNKGPTHAVTSFADITDDFLSKKLIEKEKTNLKFILDSIPHMIGLWSVEEINIESNLVYSDYFNKIPEQIRGLHMRELLGDELYLKNIPYIKKALAGEKVTFERELRYKDGSIHSTMATYSPNFDDNKKVVSFLAMVIDITELKKLESDQRILEARLAESAKLTVLGEMAAGVAHEVNTPLAIIKVKTATLIRKANMETLDLNTVLADLKVIEKTTERIAKIVKALKTYSRNADNDDFETANLTLIIEDTLELCQERFKNSSIEIRMFCEPELNFSCRTVQISQIIMNLLNNSYDAILASEAKWIEIRAFKENDKLHLHITDSGLGIPKAIVDKMMNPFFTTKEIGKGTGLGLSISTGIVKSHGGTFNYCENSINTKFILTFPELVKSSI